MKLVSFVCNCLICILEKLFFGAYELTLRSLTTSKMSMYVTFTRRMEERKARKPSALRPYLFSLDDVRLLILSDGYADAVVINNCQFPTSQRPNSILLIF